MTTQPIDLRLPRHPLAPRDPHGAAPTEGNAARDEAFALSFERAPGLNRRDSEATNRLAEALRTQLRDLQAQQKAIRKLLEGLGD